MTFSSELVRRNGMVTTTKVLVVDDSAFMRALVSEIVCSSGEFAVAGTARDGEEAIHQVLALDPDIVTLDIDMPRTDGLDALRRIMRVSPRPVVMLSAGGSDGGAAATIRALELGAVDFVRKPSGAISLDLETVREQLLDALRTAATANRQILAGGIRTRLFAGSPNHVFRSSEQSWRERAARLISRRSVDSGASSVVCIACSTGGPAALTRLVPSLPKFEHTAVVIAQHMPEGFTRSLAERLDGLSDLRVQEAEDGEEPKSGTAYVAPGGLHMRIDGNLSRPRFALDSAPAEWGVRPAADVLFRSVAQVYRSSSVGVVMTGMGRDGAAGLSAIRKAGGKAIVQDSASSVIAGMPEAALKVAGADRVEPLDALAKAIVEEVEHLKNRVVRETCNDDTRHAG